MLSATRGCVRPSPDSNIVLRGDEDTSSKRTLIVTDALRRGDLSARYPEHLRAR